MFDYYDKIPEPMCFLRIQKNIDEGKYETGSDFIHDINLIFHNAFLYFDPENRYYKAAKLLQEKFHMTSSRVPIKLNKEDSQTIFQKILNQSKYLYSQTKEKNVFFVET